MRPPMAPRIAIRCYRVSDDRVVFDAIFVPKNSNGVFSTSAFVYATDKHMLNINKKSNSFSVYEPVFIDRIETINGYRYVYDL